jgi:hypothetical protein
MGRRKEKGYGTRVTTLKEAEKENRIFRRMVSLVIPFGTRALG